MFSQDADRRNLWLHKKSVTQGHWSQLTTGSGSLVSQCRSEVLLLSPPLHQVRDLSINHLLPGVMRWLLRGKEKERLFFCHNRNQSKAGCKEFWLIGLSPSIFTSALLPKFFIVLFSIVLFFNSRLLSTPNSRHFDPQRQNPLSISFLVERNLNSYAYIKDKSINFPAVFFSNFGI